MAAYIFNDGDRIVANVDARNALPKFDGMKVTVNDAIADTLTGGGMATYQWSNTANRWLLLWKDNKDNVNFTTEQVVIANGKAILAYPPSSATVWDTFILETVAGQDEPVVIAEFNTPNLVNNEIILGSSIYDGKTLSATYAYSAVEAAVHELVSSYIAW